MAADRPTSWGMTDDPKARAEARLERALAAAAVRDPRPLYRPVLRYLREYRPAGFERAIRDFDDRLVPAVALDADPLAAWLEFGLRLAEELGPGRVLGIDPTGRASSEEAPEHSSQLLLFLPDDPAMPALVLRYPREASIAQAATVELLVDGRVTASAYE